MFKILIAEDDRELRQLFQHVLTKNGYTVVGVSNGEEALRAMDASYYDMIISDIMMPKMDGYELVRALREAGMTIPVMMITAKDAFDDMRLGFLSGSDDYMVKPFEAKELIARIKAVMRRSGGQSEEKKVSFDNLVISLDNYSVLLDGKPVEMPPKEIELLYFLASRPGKVFTREQLLEQVWGFDFFGDSRTVDVHVKRIREKLGERDEWQLKTVWGVGYKFDVAK